MGLFDFFKRDKGKELFQANTAAEAKAQAIRDEVARMGIPGDIKVNVVDGKVKISGKVPDQATREKLLVLAGNTKHIDSVEDETEAEDGGTDAGTRFHTVESGDSLSKIAREYYGDAGAYMRIFEANKPMLEDPDKIYPGQVLRIPAEGSASA